MKILTRADAARFLLEHDHFAILSHRRPDGDTVGSSAALCRGLRQLGKTAHVLVNKEVTPRFAWLHEGLTKPWAEEGDTVVSVDVASPGDAACGLSGRCWARSPCALTITAPRPPLRSRSWWTGTAPPAPRWCGTCWS